MDHNLEFSAILCEGNHVKVGVNIRGSYDKNLATYIELDKILQNKIPFEFHILKGPKVAILDGDTRKGMAQIEITIGYKIPDIVANTLLREAGFTPFVWPSF